MNIITMWILAFSLLSAFALAGVILFYKDGKLAKDFKLYLIVVVFAVLLAAMAYHSIPEEFYIDRIIAIAGGVAAVTAFVIKKKLFFCSKILLIVSMSFNVVIAFI